MKITAGRPKDLEDVAAIASAYGARLGTDYVIETLRVTRGFYGI